MFSISISLIKIVTKRGFNGNLTEERKQKQTEVVRDTTITVKRGCERD
jgi:hypothetical protein